MCKFLTADAVAASNSIEGFKVSTDDVEDLLEDERDVDVSEGDREETLAYQRMMTYIQKLHDVADFRYSKELLNALHWMLQGHRHTPRKPAGQWRRGAVSVTDARDPGIAAYTAPDAAGVAALTGELVEWLNKDDSTHPLVRAAMAHLHLVSIHPWADGNGRMSRSLQTLMIAREGELAPKFSSIEAWLGPRTSPTGSVSTSPCTTSRRRTRAVAWTVRVGCGFCSVSSRRSGGWRRGWFPLCMTWRCPGGCVGHATNGRRVWTCSGPNATCGTWQRQAS